jgi:multidrug efflux pump subunit AcrA (membrane-fusion protein)
MQPNPSSVPAPDGPQGQPKPGPSAVPPKHIHEPRRRTGMWGILVVLVIVGAGAAYYLKTQSDAKAAAKGSLISVSTAVVGLGDLHATVRVNGTVNAQNFAALMAPRILGSRTGLNRGGDSGSTAGGGGGGGGGGGPMGDFSLVLLKLAKPGVHVKSGDVVAEFDPQNQLQRLDDYKDSAVQQENMVKKMLANLAAVKEAHDQSVRSAKADWDKAVLDLKTADVRSAIDAEKFKLTVEENDAKYKQLVAEASLVDESQRAQIRS